MKAVSQNSNSWKIVSFIVFGLMLILIGVSAYLYRQVQRLHDPEYQQTLVKNETEELVKEVGKMYLLPADETPQIMVVSKPDDLKREQPFFQKAVEGDKVLIYQSQAILYRPATKQIINV